MGQTWTDSSYRYWRKRIFFGIYTGYIAYYVTRKSFVYVSPALIQDMGLDKTDIGFIATLFYVTYGASKFVSGILSDHSNPRYFMAAGLVCTGICNILFGLGTSVAFLAMAWTLNAFFQGWGWPPCSKILTSWYSQNERGTWWGVWNTAHNIGGAAAPLLLAWYVDLFGWRHGMMAVSLAAMSATFILLGCVRDRPASMGFPTVGVWRNDEKEIAHEQENAGMAGREILFKYIFGNGRLWGLAMAYILVYLVRIAVADWGSLYLIETHGYTLLQANSVISASEVGGFFGCLVAGWGSDKWLQGNRTMMNLLFSIGIVCTILGVWLLPVCHLLYLALFFALGFFVYGPQLLIGMAAVECSHKNAAGASNGFVSLFGYLGAALAGYPVAKVMSEYGWPGFFAVLLTCSSLVIVFFTLSCWRSKNIQTFHS